MSNEEGPTYEASDVLPSGIQHQVGAKFGAQITDPGYGKHLWTVITVFALADPTVVASPTSDVHLDSENLLSIQGPGCYKCEKAWTPGLEKRFCQGVM